MNAGRVPPDFTSLFEELSTRAVGRLDGLLGEEVALQVRDEIVSLEAAGHFVPATVGRARHRDERIRADALLWLRPPAAAGVDLAADRPGIVALLAQLDAMREALSEVAMQRLVDVEVMATCYPPGGRYVRHVDRFADGSSRQFTFVYFLNPDWLRTDGGALRVLTPERRRIAARLDRLVLFHTPEVFHQVLTTHRPRYAVTGWFKTRDI